MENKREHEYPGGNQNPNIDLLCGKIRSCHSGNEVRRLFDQLPKSLSRGGLQKRHLYYLAFESEIELTRKLAIQRLQIENASKKRITRIIRHNELQKKARRSKRRLRRELL